MSILNKTLSIRSRLLIMLLAVSILASIVLIMVGYTTGKSAIESTVINQLTSIRAAKTYQIEAYFQQLNGILSVYSKDQMMIDASKEFGSAFRKLTTEQIASDCNQKLSVHYDIFAQKVSKNMNIKDNPEMYYPNTAEACYLQYNYIIQNPNPMGDKHLLMRSTTDASDYGAIHEKYHKTFNDIVQKFGLYDLFLIDLNSGDILYSVFKETDFATNLYSGPYRESNLADLARILKKSGDLDKAQMIDFAHYRPSYGAPAAFIGIALSDHLVSNAALVFQVPINEIDRIMTGGKNWQNEGMGETGETYLVGDDFYFRSNSRFFFTDSTNFTKTMLKKGYTQESLDNMHGMGTTILGLQSKSESAKAALGGQTGTRLTEDYRGVPIIAAFEPIQIAGLKWGIVCKKDQFEAFKPIRDFKYKVFISLAAIVLLISFISMWLAERFIKPILQLSEGARRISAGETDFKVGINGNDELGSLATVFNQMTENLTVQQKTLKKQNQENERLLLNFLPEGLAKRYKNGETNLVEHHSSVTVLFARIQGLDNAIKDMKPEDSFVFVSSLFQKMDDLAQRYSIEKIATRGNEYLAACGLHIQRLDHQKRSVEFALEMRKLIQNYAKTANTDLHLEVAIHTGKLTGGIVGQEKFEYNIWGDAVEQAIQMLGRKVGDQILVSNAIRQRVADLFIFEKIGENEYSVQSNINTQNNENQ
jgi:class 3 adenylate cyclase